MTTSPDFSELVLPAKQARSRETRDRLLAAGRQLLERGAFEATSIADIASDAECSVGAFYHRFADKEAFFTVVIESVLAEMVAEAKLAITYERFAEATVEATLEACVAYWIEVHLRNQGLFRTVMKKTLHEAESWKPVRRQGAATLNHFILLLAAKCGKSDSRSFQYRAEVGFQIVSGLLMNATLHRTIRLNLETGEMLAWATEILRHSLFVELPPALLALGVPTLPTGVNTLGDAEPR
jgi:AcrR family transcriptional regulator